MIRRHKYYKPKRKTHYQNLAKQEKESKEINTSSVKKIISIIFFLSAGAWFIYFFIFSNNFEIKTIQFLGNQNIPKSELRSIAKNQLNRKKWLILPQSNILLFNKDELISDIQDKYIVENIKIKKKLPFSLSIELEEKLARVVLRTKIPVNITHTTDEAEEREEVDAGIVAGEYVSHNNKDEGEADQEREQEIIYSEEYYYLDVNGIIVSSADISDSQLANFPVIEIEISEQTKISDGDVLLDREKIEFIFGAYQGLAASTENIQVSYIIYDPEKQDEMIAATQEGWQGMLSTSISLDTQIKKLELSLQEKIKDKRSSLQYVDLRIKDRVYFK